MKILFALSLSLIAADPVRYASISKRKSLRAQVTRQIEELSSTFMPSLVPALKEAWKNFEMPSMIKESVLRNMDNQSKNQCEGEGCLAGTVNFEPLHGYACWCFFGNINSSYGRGPPMDSFDAVCQKLVLCYRCIFVDSENENEDCDPYNQAYDATLLVSGIGGISNITSSCQTNNVENCAWRTCSCTMHMTTNLLNLTFDPDAVYNVDYMHSNGFDYALDCPQQGKALDRQCCGYYPNRRTFDRNEHRACCHEQTIYNPLRQQCCDDGRSIGFGGRC